MDVRGFIDVRGIEAEFESFNKDGRHWLIGYPNYVPHDFDTCISTFVFEDGFKESAVYFAGCKQ
jgi:hypothetical protein